MNIVFHQNCKPVILELGQSLRALGMAKKTRQYFSHIDTIAEEA
jgi:hypothetical protein